MRKGDVKAEILANETLCGRNLRTGVKRAFQHTSKPLRIAIQFRKLSTQHSVNNKNIHWLLFILF